MSFDFKSYIEVFLMKVVQCKARMIRVVARPFDKLATVNVQTLEMYVTSGKGDIRETFELVSKDRNGDS